MNEKELYRFVNEPKYRARIIASIHKEQDKTYEKRIKILRTEKEKLVSLRIQEIDRIKQSRWENISISPTSSKNQNHYQLLYFYQINNFHHNTHHMKV